MRLDTHGKLTDEPEIKAAFIGCGSHSFRNLFPTFAFAHVNLVAVCDLDEAKAKAFATTFGASKAYTDHNAMLDQEDLDVVYICTGYDKNARPLYPRLAADCLNAKCHVWIEKPPAATVADLTELKSIAEKNGKWVMTGLKKMFFPANEKAASLMTHPDFGNISYAQLQYPQHIPDHTLIQDYIDGNNANREVVSFLDHLCHPVSLMIYLLGRPTTVMYERSRANNGVAIFTFDNGVVCNLALTGGASNNGGMERTMLIGDKGSHITVDNGHKVALHRSPSLKYGKSTSYFEGEDSGASLTWDPEFSLGNLHNKGLFLLGYYGEIEECAQAALHDRKPSKAGINDAIAVTAIFEAFAKAPGQSIKIEYPVMQGATA